VSFNRANTGGSVVKYASDTTAQVIARMKSETVRGMMEQVAAGAEQLNATSSTRWTQSRPPFQNVSEYVSSTAAAVEEQSTVTGEMSSSMRRAAAEAASIGQAA
jgi:methyl-accepting chemotaxis protein